MNNYLTLKYDAVFKTIFKDKSKMTALLDEIFQKKVSIIKFKLNELTVPNTKVRTKRLDCVIQMEGRLVNLEINTSYNKETINRNFAFFTDMYSKKVLKGKIYNDGVEAYHISLNFGIKNECSKENYVMTSKITGKKLPVQFEYIEVYVDNYKQFWYDRNIKAIKKYPILISLDLDNKEIEEFSEYTKDARVKELKEAVKKINEDDIFTFSISPEEDIEFYRNTLISTGKREGLEKGLKEGKKEGRKEGRKEIINKMFASGITLTKIAQIVDLPEADVKKLIVK